MLKLCSLLTDIPFAANIYYNSVGMNCVRNTLVLAFGGKGSLVAAHTCRLLVLFNVLIASPTSNIQAESTGYRSGGSIFVTSWLLGEWTLDCKILWFSTPYLVLCKWTKLDCYKIKDFKQTNIYLFLKDQFTIWLRNTIWTFSQDWNMPQHPY